MMVCVIQTWTCRSDPVLHIELRKWADLFLLAPLDANTLAKVATGLCDNLLVRALLVLSFRGLVSYIALFKHSYLKERSVYY